MASLLQLPETPRRGGRSRFSKALPMPPSPQIVERTATTPHSRLPPLPIMATNTVNRRPVGGQTHATNASIVSMNSVTSVYSDTPGFSGNNSTTSTSPRTKDDSLNCDSDPWSGSSPLPPTQDAQPSQPDNTIASREGFQCSPPRKALWIRRSLTSDKAVAFPELQLDKSNGSTASPPRKGLPAIPNQLPRSIGGRKPVPLQKDHIPLRGAPQPPNAMGNKLSKLEGKLSKLKHNAISKKKKSNESEPSPVKPSSGRLPTPEYQRTDKQQPPTPQIMSPVSPETPPNDVSPQVPQRSEWRSTSNDISPPAKDQPPILSFTASEPLTITSSPAMRSPQPKKALPIPILTPEASPSSTSFPTPTIRSPTALQSPNFHGNTHFPTQPQRSPPGTVLPGLPLTLTQLECYTSHKHMRRANNNVCPVACMVCQRKDLEARWRCMWCSVSACAGCMQVLERVDGRDLRGVIAKVKR